MTEETNKEIELKINKSILYKYTKYFVMLIISIISIPVIIYLLKFGTWHLSDDFKMWTDFASYIDSFITPLLSLIAIGIAIINIMVLYQLTQSAKIIEKQSLSTQLKKEEYVQIKKRIDIFLESILKLKESESEKKIKAKELIIYINSFLDDYEFLFKNLKNEEISDKIIATLEKYKETYNITEFLIVKKDFLQKIQTEIINN